MLIVLIFFTYLQTPNFHLLHNLLLSSFLLPSSISSLITLSLFFLLCMVFSSTPYFLSAGKRCFFLSSLFFPFFFLVVVFLFSCTDYKRLLELQSIHGPNPNTNTFYMQIHLTSRRCRDILKKKNKPTFS